MKKTIPLLITTLLLAVFVTACGGADEEVTAADVPAGTAVPGGGFAGSLPESTQLVLGTLKLDETDNAIDGAQAATLLPLWKAVRSLSESETAAQAEVDALYKQIRGAMTSEQLEAIAAMELTRQDMAAVADELGLDFAARGFGGEITPEMQATMQALRESGQGPPEGFMPGMGPGGGEGFPGGGQGPGGGGGFPGGGFGGGEDMTPEQRQTAIAERGGTRGMNTAMDAVFIDALIEMLEALAAE